MKKRYWWVIGVAIVILLSISFWFGMKSKPKSNTQGKAEAVRTKELVITLGKNGFSPDTITIKTETPVRWINKSGKPQTVNSDNYPTNRLHRQLNFGVFGNGSSVTYTFTMPGVYGYHNQFIHTQVGKITVVN
jgi:plastocyanin